MKLEIKVPPYVQKINHSLFAHYGIISFVLAMSTLIYCVYSIQLLMTAPSDTDYRDQQLQKNTKTSFDKTTIDQVDQLRTTSDSTPITLPSGRINPFSE